MKNNQCDCKRIGPNYETGYDGHRNIFVKNLTCGDKKGLEMYVSTFTDPYCFLQIEHDIFPRPFYDQSFLYFNGITLLGIEPRKGINKIDQDIFCKHKNLFMTVDQLSDLEILLYLNSETVLKYFQKIGFGLTEEWIWP